jgi:hypothetical protein
MNISEIHRVFIQGTTLLVGCEWTFEFLELCDVKSHHELKSRTASCDYWVPAQSSLIWSKLFIGKPNGHAVSCTGKLTSGRFHEVLMQLQSYWDLRVMIKSLWRSEHVRTDCSELICPNLSELNLLDPPCSNWSTCFFFFASFSCIAAPPLSHIYLSTTNVEHLGSITFSDMLKLIPTRREFTSWCSFLARLRVIGSWFIFVGVLCSSTCVTA